MVLFPAWLKISSKLIGIHVCQRRYDTLGRIKSIPILNHSQHNAKTILARLQSRLVLLACLETVLGPGLTEFQYWPRRFSLL